VPIVTCEIVMVIKNDLHLIDILSCCWRKTLAIRTCVLWTHAI